MKHKYIRHLVDLCDYAIHRLVNAENMHPAVIGCSKVGISTRNTGSIEIAVYWSKAVDWVAKSIDPDDPELECLQGMPILKDCRTVAEVDAVMVELYGFACIAEKELEKAEESR